MIEAIVEAEARGRTLKLRVESYAQLAIDKTTKIGV